MAATDRLFQDMLNDNLSNELLREDHTKKDWLLSKVEKDESWLGGPLVVPFQGAQASSIAAGSLTAASDVAQSAYIRGEVTVQPEIWGTMLFNHRDLMEHGKISEKNFLKILPGEVENFTDRMKEVTSVALMNGAHFAKLTANYTGTDGVLTVNFPERFTIGQKVIVKDVTAAYTTYVKSINMNAKTVSVVTTRGGSTTDFSAGVDVVASSGKCYNDGFQTVSFSSLRDALLSAANGGSSTLYGQTKVTYPYLQAINVNGGSGGAAEITTTALTGAATIMAGLFNALMEIRRIGKGNPTEAVMSYKNFGLALKVIEASKGAYNVSPGSSKASQFGWSELEVGGIKGGIKLTAVPEMDDDVIFFLDWRALKFYSNGGFRKRQSPDGNEYFEVRNTTGYQYLIDICLFGDLVVHRPSYCGVIYGIVWA